jgi:hypothetical protein
VLAHVIAVIVPEDYKGVVELPRLSQALEQLRDRLVDAAHGPKPLAVLTIVLSPVLIAYAGELAHPLGLVGDVRLLECRGSRIALALVVVCVLRLGVGGNVGLLKAT